MTVASSSSHVALRPQRTIRDGEPRTSTSTFTQLLNYDSESSSSVLLYVHRDRTDYHGRGSPGRPPPRSHSSWALKVTVALHSLCVSEYTPKWLQRCLVVTWLVRCEIAAVSAQVLYTPYNHALVYTVTLFEATCIGCTCV